MRWKKLNETCWKMFVICPDWITEIMLAITVTLGIPWQCLTYGKKCSGCTKQNPFKVGCKSMQWKHQDNHGVKVTTSLARKITSMLSEPDEQYRSFDVVRVKYTIHADLMFHPKTDHFCEYIDSGYTHLQLKWFNTVRGLVGRYWNHSQSNRWK